MFKTSSLARLAPRSVLVATLCAALPISVLVAGCSGGSSSLGQSEKTTLFSNLAIPLDQNRVGRISGERSGDNFEGTLEVPALATAASGPKTSLLRLLIDRGRYPLKGRFSSGTNFSGEGEVRVGGTPTPLTFNGSLPSGSTNGSVSVQVGSDSTSTSIPATQPTTAPTTAPTAGPAFLYAGVYNGVFRNTSGPDLGETGPVRLNVNNSGDAVLNTLSNNSVDDTFTGRVANGGNLTLTGRSTEGFNVSISMSLQGTALSRSTGTYSSSDGNRGVVEVVKAGATNPFTQFAGTYDGTYTFTNGPEAGQSDNFGFTINSTGLLTLPNDDDFVVAQLQTNGQVVIYESYPDEGVNITSTLQIRAGGRGTVSTGTFVESNGVRGTLRVLKQ